VGSEASIVNGGQSVEECSVAIALEQLLASVISTQATQHHPQRHTDHPREVHTVGKRPRCQSVVMPVVAWAGSHALSRSPLLTSPRHLSSEHRNHRESHHTNITMMLLSARQALRTAARTVRVPVTAAARSVATNAKVSLSCVVVSLS